MDRKAEPVPQNRADDYALVMPFYLLEWWQ